MVKIEEIIDDFEKDDLKACRFKIFKIVLSYNSDIKDGKPYNHELKHLLFKSNFIRNPMGKKYSSKDYEKVSRLLLGILNIFKAINDSTKETPELFSKDLKIDVRIIKDIVSIMIYLECFYKMNLNNSKRMDECETSKIPFVEQLFSIILFYQDQTYLFRENIDNYFNNTCITGMELSVANIPVNYYDKLESSVLDNFESILESTNEIVHYLYYQFGKKLEMKILDTNINFEIIQPYQNKEFEKYLYIALQRSSLCKLEEGIRFGYYEFGKYFNKSEDKAQAYIFTLEDNDKYKTRRTGIFRRQYQLYNAIQKIKSTYDNDNLEMLAEELVSIQKNSKLLDFNQFHPKINLFNSAEEYSKLNALF